MRKSVEQDIREALDATGPPAAFYEHTIGWWENMTGRQYSVVRNALNKLTDEGVLTKRYSRGTHLYRKAPPVVPEHHEVVDGVDLTQTI